MDDLRTILDGLDGVKLSYVYARSKVHSRSEAFRESGLSKSAFYEYPDEEQARLDDLAEQLRRNRVLMAEPKLNDNVEKAVDVLVTLLTARSEYVRLQAAQAIIERVMGPVVKKTDVTSGGQGISFIVAGVLDGDAADHLAEPVSQTGGLR